MTPRRFLAGLSSLFFLLAFQQSAGATSISLSTGQNSGGSIITTDLGCDAHWVVVAGGPTPACAGAHGQVVMPGDADSGFPSWVANSTSSAWITNNASITGNGAPLPVTYQVQFLLSDLIGASITGSWTIDDAGSISLNGHSIGTLGGGNWVALNGISGTASSDLVAGLNTLSISITSSDDFLEGVRFDGSVTGDGAAFIAAVPEPATLTLTALGLVAVARRRLRARRG
jgi:hypothetical protein